jgi:hypothetical protein
MLRELESMGFLGYKYIPSRHFLRPIMPDGSPSELISGQNLYHEMLTLRTFPGCEKLFATQMGSADKRTCLGVFPYTYSDGTIYLIFCFPDKIYKYKAGDTTPTEIQGAVTLTGSNTQYFSAAYFADTSGGYDPWIVLTNGKDTPVYWDGTGNCAALGGSPPIGKYIDSFQNHLFISNVTSGGVDYTQRDYRSDVDEADDWAGGTAGTNDLRQSAGDVQGSLVFGDMRFIFKENSISLCRATGIDPPFLYNEDELPIGCAAPKTLTKVWRYDYGFFLGSDLNCYLIRKDGAYMPIGDNITHRIREWANDDALKYAFSVYYPDKDQVLLVLPSTGTAGEYNDQILAFDLGYYMITDGAEKVWSTPIVTGKYFTAGSIAKFRQPYTIGDLGAVSSDGLIGGIAGTIGNLYMEAAFSEIVLCDNDGYAYRFDDSLNDWDGTTISWEAEFKDNHLTGARTDRFRLQEYELMFRNAKTVLATCNSQVSVDGGSTYTTAQAMTLYNANVAADDELYESAWFDSVGNKHRMKLDGTYPVHLLGQRWAGTKEGRD